MKTLTKDDVVKAIRERMKDLTAREFAKSIGVSPQYLNDVLHGRRAPGPSILKALNIQQGYFHQ